MTHAPKPTLSIFRGAALLAASLLLMAVESGAEVTIKGGKTSQLDVEADGRFSVKRDRLSSFESYNFSDDDDCLGYGCAVQAVSVNEAFGEDGISGTIRSSTSASSSVTLAPEGGLFVLSASGSGTLTAMTTASVSEDDQVMLASASSTVVFDLVFEVDQTYDLNLNFAVSGSGTGSGSVDTFELNEDFDLAGGAPQINHTATLAPGFYTLRFVLSVGGFACGDGDCTPETGNMGFSFNLTLTEPACPAKMSRGQDGQCVLSCTETMQWVNAAGGAFNQASNWNPDQVPEGFSQAAVFRQASPYTVSHAPANTSGCLSVESGEVTFSNNALSVQQDAQILAGANLNLATHDLQIGRTIELLGPLTGTPASVHIGTGSTLAAPVVSLSEGQAELTVADGAQLLGGEIVVGSQLGADATLNASGSATLVETDSKAGVQIGKGGDGLFLLEGGLLRTGFLAVGGMDGPFRGNGTFEARDANIEVEQMIVGGQSIGSALFERTVFQLGSATTIANIDIGSEALGNGTLIFRESDLTVGLAGGTMNVGIEGTGRLEILDGSRVTLDEASGLLLFTIGSALDSSGTVVINGAGSELKADGWNLTVGAGGLGRLRLENGAQASFSVASVGGNAGADGDISIRDSALAIKFGDDKPPPDLLELELVLTIGADGRIDVADGGTLNSEVIVMNGGEGDQRASLVVSGTGTTLTTNALVAGLNRKSVIVVDDGAVATMKPTDATAPSNSFLLGGSSSVLVRAGALLETSRAFIGATTVDEVIEPSVLADIEIAGAGAQWTADSIDLSAPPPPAQQGVIQPVSSHASRLCLRADTSVVTGRIEVHTAGTLVGDSASVQALSGTLVVSNGGRVIPGGDCSIGPARGVRVPGALTIEGDYAQTDGILEIPVTGSNAGGQLLTTGDIDFLGGAIEFAFADGYLPRKGDAVSFLASESGNVTGLESLALDYCGAERGFEYHLTMEPDGTVTMVADNDAQAVDWLFSAGFELSELPQPGGPCGSLP